MKKFFIIGIKSQYDDYATVEEYEKEDEVLEALTSFHSVHHIIEGKELKAKPIEVVTKFEFEN